MARKSKVTRTIKITEVTILCLNTETAEPFNKTVNLPGYIKDTGGMLKKAKNLYETDEVKLVKVVDYEFVEKKYAMGIIEFIAVAEELK